MLYFKDLLGVSMDFISLSEMFARPAGLFLNSADSPNSVTMFFLTFTMIPAVIGFITFMIINPLKNKIMKSLVTVISLVSILALFSSILDFSKTSAQIDAVETAAVKNIEQKLNMSNISNVEIAFKEEVVTATAKYMNIADRSSAELTIAFEDSGEPFVLTSEFVTPEFIKTLEK
jgi:hypothetical protein